MGEVCFDHGSITLEGMVFPSTLTPPRSRKSLFLGGAGTRGMHINGKFKVFTLHGVYLESDAVQFLTRKWQGKSVEQLASSNQFFHDIITGPFDKLSQITLAAHLGGKQFAQKVVENCTSYLKKNCLYSQNEEKAAKEFQKKFETMDLPPGSTIFFTYSASGHLTVAISEDASVPEVEVGTIDCRNLTEAVLASIVGENGVSPAAKLSIATRMYDVMSVA